jgi:2-dehydro-3-deoxygalactonokinase
MRGEETEILGLFADGRYSRIAEEGIVVLPGTHSKHVRLHGRQLTTFRTYLTGELFDVLSAHSLLRASVQSADGVPAAPWSQPASQEAFIAGVQSAAATGLAGSLFQTRARTVLHSVSPAVNRWFLSGSLIGSEAAELSTAQSDLPILLAAAGPLSDAYRLAFATLGFAPRLTVVPPEEMAVASVRGHRTLLRRAQSRIVPV